MVMRRFTTIVSVMWVLAAPSVGSANGYDVYMIHSYATNPTSHGTSSNDYADKEWWPGINTITVRVIAHAVWSDLLGTYIPYNEDLYGNASRNTYLAVTEPGSISTSPAGVLVSSGTTNNWSYSVTVNDNPCCIDCGTYCYFQASCLDGFNSTELPNPHWSTYGTATDSGNVSKSGSTWHCKPTGASFEAGRVSVTAHADMGEETTLSATAQGTASASYSVNMNGTCTP